MEKAYQSTYRIRVMIADDRREMRDFLQRHLEQLDDVEIVGQAKDGNAALIMAQQITPDVILMDLDLPVISGLAATRLIRSRFPDIRIVVFSLHTDRWTVRSVIEAGAIGYVAKDSSPSQLGRAIRNAYDNQLYVSEQLENALRPYSLNEQ